LATVRVGKTGLGAQIMLRANLTAAVLAVLLGIGMSSAQAAMVMKAGHNQGADSAQGKALLFFAEQVGEMSNGELEVEVFHDLTLGPVATQLENVVSGAQAFYIDTMDYFKVWDEAFGVINTPFVFRSKEHFLKYLQSDAFAQTIDNVEQRGLVFLGKEKYNWVRTGDRGLLTKDPIFTPEDLQGYKIRMFQAEMPIKAWAALGADVNVIAWGDVYTALATGLVDGLTTPISGGYLNKLTEQTRYFTNLKEYFQILAPIVSRRLWDELTPEQQQIVEDAAFEAGELYAELSLEEDLELTRKAQEEHGLTIILPPLKPWHDKMKPLYVEFEAAGLLPEGIVEQAQAIQE
jgi:TRAP-type C4-dicarboxylate transport system substrate-binding protein